MYNNPRGLSHASSQNPGKVKTLNKTTKFRLLNKKPVFVLQAFRSKMKFSTKLIVQSALIAAVYSALTILLGSFGYGPIQFRIAEALTVLPVILPSSITGLFIGCILANWLGGFGIADIFFGSLATLLAGIFTRILRKHNFLFPLPPVLFNAIIVGGYVYVLYDKTYPLLLTMLFIGLSELIICYGIGLPLITFIKKNYSLRRILGIDNN